VQRGIVEFLRTKEGRQASNTEVREAMNKKFGTDLPQSTIRSLLQNESLFESVSRGVHRLKDGV
jgi:hypothetical protein